MPGILDQAPDKLIQQILAAFDVQAIYHKKDHQVTIRATITTSTPRTVLAIIADAAALTAQQAATHDTDSDLVIRPIDPTIRTVPGLRCRCC